MKSERKALGRGLSSLITPTAVSIVPTTNTAEEMGGTPMGDIRPQVRYVPISQVINNPKQPRVNFSEEELGELAESIKTHGILQPILVRPVGGNLQIIAGERRWRASQKAGLTQIPVMEKNLSDGETFQIALVENIQRSQLNPVEEARAYERLTREFGLTQEEIAEATGKNRTTVANFLRLLKLSHEVLNLVESGKLSAGHAKAIIAVREPSAQLSLAKKVVDENLSVRELEQLVARAVILDGGAPSRKTMFPKAEEVSRPEISEVERRLREELGTRVTVHIGHNGKGNIRVDFFSEEELDRLVDLITPTT
jgi:ParB family transcriptional regulator, chromosome partitioning protein